MENTIARNFSKKLKKKQMCYKTNIFSFFISTPLYFLYVRYKIQNFVMFQLWYGEKLAIVE